MKKLVSIAIYFSGAVLIEAALCYFAARTGLWLFPFVGIYLIPILLGLYFIIGRLLSKKFHFTELKVRTIQGGFLLAVVLCIFVNGYLSGTPQATFERLVMKPMLASVRDFKWGGWSTMDSSYALSFKASREDIERIIQYRHLKPDPDFWGLGSGHLSQAEIVEQMNLKLSGMCSSVGIPYKKLGSIVLYRSPDSNRHGWTGELYTDDAHQQVYLFLH